MMKMIRDWDAWNDSLAVDKSKDNGDGIGTFMSL